MTERHTAHARALLDFESNWSGATGHKGEAIRVAFDFSVTRYCQALNEVIDTPAAEEAEPNLVHRLLREQARVRAARASRTFGRKR